MRCYVTNVTVQALLKVIERQKWVVWGDWTVATAVTNLGSIFEAPDEEFGAFAVVYDPRDPTPQALALVCTCMMSS